MHRTLIFALIAASVCSVSLAEPAHHSQALDDLTARYARRHGVPEQLVQQVVLRESGYNPASVNGRFYGLMQITYETARSMGYTGEAKGLLDPEVNLTYAVPYLANAYRLADGDEARVIRLYSAGYYDLAKRKNLLSVLRTAESPSLEKPEPAAGTSK
jgi:soluble lytic murein transglycosylase-like protein